MSEIKPKSNRGGARVGAGRPRKNQTNFSAYEGAGWNPNRGVIYLPTVEAPKELQPSTRVELLKKARWMVNNIGMAKRAIDGVARYAIGTGIIPQARTKNSAWNSTAEQAFEDAVCNVAWAFDISGSVNFYEAQSLILRQMLTDGDFFAQLSASQDGRGMVRFIGAESIGTGQKNTDGLTDGVRVDVNGRARTFRILADTNGDKWSEVDATDIIHFRRVHRFGYARGVSCLAHAVNHLHDMAEVLSYTKGSFKLASQIGLVVTSPNGKIGLGSSLRTTEASEPGSDDARSITTSDSLFSASGRLNLKTGEDVKTLQNTHPGDSFIPFMDYLTRDIAWGLGLSPEILWNITDAGGANTRFVLQDAQTYFAELQQLVINQFCRRFWLYWIWHEIEAGRLEHPGDDWWRVDFIPPKGITVDVGREGALYANLVAQGMMSKKRWFAMQGLDWEAELADIAAERAASVTPVSP